jgi:hypothetical protein
MTYPADLATIEAAIAYLRHLGVVKVGRIELKQMERATLKAHNAQEAIDRIRALLDAEFTGCMVAGAEDGE